VARLPGITGVVNEIIALPPTRRTMTRH
jgi:hypothetical protein